MIATIAKTPTHRASFSSAETIVGTLQRAASTGGGCGPNGRPTTAYTITINSQSAASLDEMASLTEGDKSLRHHGPPMIVGGLGMGGEGRGGGAGVAAAPGTIVNVSTERFRLSSYGSYGPIFPQGMWVVVVTQ